MSASYNNDVYSNCSNAAQITPCYCRNCVDYILKTDIEHFHFINEFINEFIVFKLPHSPRVILNFSEYIAFSHTKQQIHNFMTPYIICQCCSRHTGDVSLSDLPKISKGISPDADEQDYQEPHACICDCRHKLRILTKSIDILIHK